MGDPADAYAYDVDDFLELLSAVRPPWMRDAACREHNGRRWFPALGEATTPAKAVCGVCLVRSECLAFALEHDEEGVWGGTTPRERRLLRREAG